VASAAWLISRVFVGLDFTDEMQYYGEVASLTRTSKFFQDDLFIQQLGYLFVLPFFKLHALVFPDQSYLVLWGRLLCLASYLLVGLLFWRAASQLGVFSPQQKLTGLAALFAWVPCQIFALSYNSMAYLLVVSLLALRLMPDRTRDWRNAVVSSALLAALTVAYPPAGLALTATALMDAWLRSGWRSALGLLALTASSCVLIAGIIVGLHGFIFWRDLKVSIGFGRAFGEGRTLLRPDHLTGWLALTAASGLFIRRLYRRAAFASPFSRYGPSVAQWATGLTAAAGAAVLLWLSVRWSTGHFAMAVFVALAWLLAGSVRPTDDHVPADLAIIGLLAGSVFAFSSGNGLQNFGLGAAGVLPFFVLYGMRYVEDRGGSTLPGVVRQAALPAMVALLLLNGALHPYREQRGWSGMQPVQGVPAFKGIWTSPAKIMALDLFRQLSAPGALRGKRVLVAGPHPWLYFASGGQPTTPMIFMHFTAEQETVYDLVAARLFQGGTPDAIFVTNYVPLPVGKRIAEWTNESCSVRSVALPIGFIRRYRQQTTYDFAGQAYLLTRQPKVP
jgi:hypothetical protein